MTELASLPVGPPQGSSTPGFGTDGIRGRVGTLITPALALQVGYWCGHVLPAKGPVLIGMDSRTSSPMLAAALTAGLTAAGREVWNLGLCPTPAVPGSIRRLGAAGGLMVSASHNPTGRQRHQVVRLLRRQTQQRGAAGHRSRSAREPGATATNDRGEDGAYRCGPAHQRTDLLADYSTALLESVAGKPSAGLQNRSRSLLGIGHRLWR